jgi:two-component system NarL family sensor kinase
VLSRELHDEAGQALIILKYGLLALQSELPENHPPAQQRLMELIVIIDQTMQHIRALAHDLRPPVLEIGGINLSLQDYCQEMAKRTGIPIHYQGRDIPQLPDEISISLFRFVQEALTNSLKHSKATKMKVSLKYNDGQIILSVMDNGHGIDGTAQTSGLGLLGIKERLNLLDGLLEVHSQKNRGARLVARVPWAMSAVK